MSGPLIGALESKDSARLNALLSPILKADLGPIRLEQTAGERFTGGKSTPVWKLFFTATRGDKSKETQLVAKWVQPSTEFRKLSYANERQFYFSAAPLARKSCRLPHLLLSEIESSSACFLMDDLTVDFALHPEAFGEDEAHAALRWLAHFHACFWEADSAGGCFPAGMFPSGDYWGLSRGDNEDRLQGVPNSLFASSKVLKSCGVWDTVRALGARLAAAARPLDLVLRGSKASRGFVKHRTLLHGDFKPANTFLRECAPGKFEAAAVDFEFAGPGLVAVDLANLLFPDLRMNLLEQETDLLRFYHGALQERLDELGKGDDFSFELLGIHYAAARCDYMRYMLGRGWTACSASDATILIAVDRDLRRVDDGETLTPEEYEQKLLSLFRS